jgi:threonine synthase
VVFSMGDGCTIAGAWKGFREFHELGYVDETPKMLGVQAEGAAAIHDAFHDHADADAVAETVADSIAVGRPRNTVKACRALEESDGTSVLVSDEEILEAEARLGRTEGIYAEPAGAAPVAGVERALAEGVIEPDETVVVAVTGFGLKDSESARAAAGDATSIAPDIEAVRSRYEPDGTGGTRV